MLCVMRGEKNGSTEESTKSIKACFPRVLFRSSLWYHQKHDDNLGSVLFSCKQTHAHSWFSPFGLRGNVTVRFIFRASKAGPYFTMGLFYWARASLFCSSVHSASGVGGCGKGRGWWFVLAPSSGLVSLRRNICKVLFRYAGKQAKSRSLHVMTYSQSSCFMLILYVCVCTFCIYNSSIHFL